MSDASDTTEVILRLNPKFYAGNQCIQVNNLIPAQEGVMSVQ